MLTQAADLLNFFHFFVDILCNIYYTYDVQFNSIEQYEGKIMGRPGHGQ